MKYLITISTCYDFELNGNNDVLRKTWLRDLPARVDYKMVVGVGQGGESNTRPDYLHVEALDDYGHLTYKTQQSHGWAFEQGYDFVFQCFPDTFVVPERLFACDFEKYDYYGDFRGEGKDSDDLSKGKNYASGGAGYWLSRRACGVIKDAPILGIWRDELMVYVEDMWVGNILGRYNDTAENKLTYFDDTQRFMNRGEIASSWPAAHNPYVTAHLSCGVTNRYDPKNMLHAYASWKRGHEQSA